MLVNSLKDFLLNFIYSKDRIINILAKKNKTGSQLFSII